MHQSFLNEKVYLIEYIQFSKKQWWITLVIGPILEILIWKGQIPVKIVEIWWKSMYNPIFSSFWKDWTVWHIRFLFLIDLQPVHSQSILLLLKRTIDLDLGVQNQNQMQSQLIWLKTTHKVTTKTILSYSVVKAFSEVLLQDQDWHCNIFQEQNQDQSVNKKKVNSAHR